MRACRNPDKNPTPINPHSAGSTTPRTRARDAAQGPVDTANQLAGVPERGMDPHQPNNARVTRDNMMMPVHAVSTA